jgi:hypothetical protein
MRIFPGRRRWRISDRCFVKVCRVVFEYLAAPLSVKTSSSGVAGFTLAFFTSKTSMNPNKTRYDFVRMKTADAPEYVLEVEQVVNAALEDAGYKSVPGYVQVKRWMKACPDQDWSSAAVRQENTKDIVGKALKWAKKERLPRRDRSEPSSVPKELTWTSVGVAYATAGKVQARVEEVRQEFWGTPKPPFATSAQGREAALSWVRQVIREDEAALEGRRPGRATFSVTLEADKLGRFTTRSARFSKKLRHRSR